MVIVDQHRCVYCGGCVSVCPVEALTLAETRLVVDKDCTDCGNCLAACPVGALRQEDEPFAHKGEPFGRSYDLVVVGAGPGGATAAGTAATAGLSVLLLEKRQEIGSPVRCAEGIGHDELIRFIEPDPSWVATEVTRAEITASAGREARVLRASGGRGYVLERRIFDRVLAERAASAGAEVRVKTAATGLLMEDGWVRGVRIKMGDSDAGVTHGEVSAQVVIAADGVESQLGRWAGLQPQLPLEDTMVCVQYLIAGIDIDPSCTSYTIDYALAPGGYAWVFPKGERKANVGLGIQADLGAGETALRFLHRFIEARPHLVQGSPVTFVAGNVPVAPPPTSLVTNGLILVGDAARQVDPLTGGGIAHAMTAGKLAAEVAANAIAARDPSLEFLRDYEEQWRRSIGRKMERNYRLRAKFAPRQRTDERFIRVFALAAAG